MIFNWMSGRMGGKGFTPDRIDGRMALWFLGGFWAETTTCEIITQMFRFFFTLGFLNKACSCDRGSQYFFLLHEIEFKV